MTLTTMFRRPIVAAVALAAGAAIALTGCSSSDDSTGADASQSAVQSAELTVEQAQTTLRTALDAKTPDAELDNVVQFSDPAVKTGLTAYNEKADAAGYTPDIYTAKSVKIEGDTATAVVSVKGPHQPAAMDMNFTFVNVDGTWKLTSETVTMLSSMMR